MPHLFSTKSGRVATAYALAYASGATVYLASLERWVREKPVTGSALDVRQLTLEMILVFATSGFLFFLVLGLKRREERNLDDIRRRDRALVNAEGRVSSGLIAASIAHDAHNVLVAIVGEAEELADGATPAQRDAAGRLMSAVEELTKLHQRVMSTSIDEGVVEREPVELVRAARESVRVLRSHRSLRGCSVTVRGDESVVALAHARVTHRVLSNLLLNAAEATEGRGCIEVRVERRGDQCALEVHDDGPGIPPERRAHLFDALQSTKSEGHGLGLFSVRECVERVGGRVEVDRSPLGGALFCVTLTVSAEHVEFA